MSGIGNISARTTSLQLSQHLLASLRRTQNGLLTAQDQISTGLAVQRPSDAPASTSAILFLQSRLEARAQHQQNLDFAGGVLDNTDQALRDASDLLVEAKSIASSQIGVGSNADTRHAEATVIDAQIQALVQMANRRYQGVSLFGGSATPGNGTDNAPVFQEFLGGVRYVGWRTNLGADVGLDAPLDINANGQDAFAGLSSRVRSAIDLDPSATAGTCLDDVNGAQDQGVRRGAILLTVDGNDVLVDLATADTLGDVVTRLNDAINGVDPAAGALAIPAAGGGFELTANAGHTLSIAEAGTGGQTATDLGLVLTATGATVAGADLDPRITALTDLGSLGVAVDWVGGLKITQGNQTKIADFSGAATVQDLMNVIDSLGLGLRLEINAEENSLNLVSEVSGIELSVAENAGGTTATDLGLRSYGMDTRLADMNHGLGVHNVEGQDDFAIQLHDGTYAPLQVNIDGVTTVTELIGRIRTAAEGVVGVGNVGAPGDAGTLFNVGLAPDGNGLVFEDGTAGANDFRVRQLGASLTATDLGLYQNAGAGNSITGDDVAMVRAESVFTHLIALRDALLGNDERGITLAATGLETDIDNLARVRADIGVRAQRVQQEKERSEELKIAEQTALGALRDADMSQVITRFTQLQQQLEATLRVGAQNLQLSLLDFLR